MGLVVGGASGPTMREDPIASVLCEVINVSKALRQAVAEAGEKLRLARVRREFLAETRKRYGPWYARKANELLETDHRVSTVRQYIRHIARFRAWMEEHHKPDLCPQTVRAYLSWLASSGRPCSRSVALCAIRAVYEYKDGEHPSVSAGIRHPEPRAPRASLTPQHVSDLAAAAVTLREKLAVLLTNQFGFRVVDIISMTVGRLQLCEGRLWVSGSAFPESRQGVKLNEDLARELSLLIENGNPDDWLFGSPIRSGRHLSRRAMYYLFGKLRERAGLDRKVCTLTTLRKATCASVVALDAGVKADCAGCLRLVGVNRAWLSRNSPVKTGTSPQNEAGALTA